VRDAAVKVKEGTAAYERDGVLFDEISYTWPVLACLENAALVNNSQLHLIDLGGSLGTSYYQNKAFLQSVQSLKWFVVEQANYIDVGKKEFENNQLQFSYSIDEVLGREKINCLLVSGSIQYFEKPKEWFEKLKGYNFESIVFDRTCFIEGKTRLTVQHVPKTIYPASLPCWFFNETEFINSFSDKYELVADFESVDENSRSIDSKKLYWKGFYFKLK
jgi:putative methyltransferase (TIGR04325 family)